MKTVLLTAVGSASAHAVCQSLKAAGYRVAGCDIYPQSWNVNAGEMDAFATVPPASDMEKYVAALLNFARNEKAEFILPLTDVEVDVLCGRKDAFRLEGITVCCPDQATAELCRDKLRMAKLLGAAGVCSVIPTDTAETLPGEIAFPLLVKPVRGRSSEGKRIVFSREELLFTLAQREDYIIQPLLDGDVYTVDCARDERGETVTLTRRERLRTGNGLGTAVEICPDHPLDAVCRAILEFAGVVGVVNVEFIRNGDEYFFLEINPRFSGGVGFSVLAGYDFPLAALACHKGKRLPAPPVFRRMTLAQRYEMKITQNPAE